MYVVLTANYDTGILQYAKQITKSLSDIDKTVMFAPLDALDVDEAVELYERINSIYPFDPIYKKIANRIEAYKPEVVFVCESNLITSRIILNLSKNTKVVICVHDVNPHPSYASVIPVLKSIVKYPYIKKAWKRSNNIILLSNNSKEVFVKKYPNTSSKVKVLKLGAHVPNVQLKCPPELNDYNKSYFLFFGRIDKYKGLLQLLQAFSNVSDKSTCDLVIAGNGTITAEEKKIIVSNSRIHLIKRYISDEEMCWLFKNTLCTVLPYTEASQSGVLSISYYYNKPVIVSNVKGLTEFVENEKTGLIYYNEHQLSECLIKMETTALSYQKRIAEYYINNLEWKKNLKECLVI